MARIPRPHGVLALWIGLLFLGGTAAIATGEPAAPETEVVAGADAGGDRVGPITPRATVALPEPTVAETTSTTAPPAPTPTTRPPVTTAPPMTAPSPPPVTMTPAGALDGSGNPSHYLLAGSGCTGQRVLLRVYGGRFQGDIADVATALPDGTWGIGLMVSPPGTYELRAQCTTDDGSVLFEYASVPFAIHP